MSGKRSSLLVYILSHHHLAARYLREILGLTSNAEPVICSTLPAISDTERAILFVLDAMSLPLPTGEYLRQIKPRFPSARFLVVDVRLSDDQLCGLLELGAHGIVEYQTLPDALPWAMKAVCRGEMAIPNALLRRYATYKHQNGSGQRHLFSTTPRENQVLELVKRRYSNREIARTLGVRESTVKYHISNILSKCNARARSELISPALEDIFGVRRE